MVNVTQAFKDSAKANVKQIVANVSDGTTTIYNTDDLKSIKLYSEGSLLHSIMRKATIRYFGSHDFLDKDLNINIGFVTANGDEYINFGTFHGYKLKQVKDQETVQLEAYDKMYEALQAWDLQEGTDITYPTTLKGLLQAICTKLGWTLGTSTFPNDDTTIESDVFTGVIKTYRQALDDIAEASGSIIYFDTDDTLKVLPIAISGTVETLSANDVLETLDIQKKFGNVGSVVLSRQPQEDNIVKQDSNPYEDEVKIVNNLIVDSDRTTWITEIFNALNGLEFYPFKASTNGMLYLQIGDRVQLNDVLGNTYETVIFGIDLTVDSAITENFFTDRPEKTSTNYNTAGIVGQNITHTEIIVDKQGNEIDLISSDLSNNYYTASEINIQHDQINSTVQNVAQQATDAQNQADSNADEIQIMQGDITTLEQRADALELEVDSIGGTNLLKNSVGLKGDIKEWQLFDNDGNLIDSVNNGTVISNTDVQINSESGSSIRLDQQYILQTFPTIEGERYTYYCRYKSNADAHVEITGQETTTVANSNEEWTTLQLIFTATASSTTLKITNTDQASGAYIQLADNIVKLGSANGWVQAPNEVYGKNYRFDKDGFAITSETDTFKSVLDNQKLAVYDTSTDKVIMYVSKDEGKITDLTVQDMLIIQRYDNPSASGRFIPSDTGLMLVINDS